MKKIVLITMVMILLMSFSAFGLGVGISAGLPVGEGLPGTNLMFSAKFDQLPFLLGLGFSLDPFYLGMTADWWAVNNNLVGILNYYIGPGLYLGVNTGSNSVVSLGGRLPIGLNIFPVEFLEGFVEIAPTIAVLPTLNFPTIGLQAAAGVRFWF